jgi:hypothetical protein
MNVSGGSVGIGFRAQAGSQLNVTGGSIGSFFSAEPGSEVNLSGGSFGSSFGASSGSTLTIAGGEFRLNGALVSGLDTVGSSVELNLPAGSVLSGTLADGTPFAFSDQALDFIADGVLTLRAAALPPVGPATINVPNDPAPPGIRQGQTLTLSEGGQLNPYFVAGPGSTLLITGGTGSGDMEAVGATVNISGGNAASNLGAFTGSQINISGGSVSRLRAYAGSQVNITGGTVCCIEAKDGSTIDISDGTILGNNANRPVFAESGSNVNISGGTIDGGNIFVGGGAELSVSGGTFNTTFQAAIGSQVNLTGTQFLLAGQPIPGLVLNEPLTIIQRDQTLSGILADGSPFSFDLNSTFVFGMDWFSPGGMLTVTLIESTPLAGDYNTDGVVDAADYVVWRNGLGSQYSQVDYDLWRANFGRMAGGQAHATAGLPSTASVPEPCASALIATLVIFASLLRMGSLRSFPTRRLR